MKKLELPEYKYILDGDGNPVQEPDATKWSIWYEANRKARQVGRDQVGDLMVSTVFLALDHNFTSEHPVLYETMVFNEKREDVPEYEERYRTKEEAEKGHARVVEAVRSAV